MREILKNREIIPYFNKILSNVLLNDSFKTVGNSEILATITETNNSITVKDLSNYKYVQLVQYSGNVILSETSIPMSLFTDSTKLSNVFYDGALLTLRIQKISNTKISCIEFTNCHSAYFIGIK